MEQIQEQIKKLEIADLRVKYFKLIAARLSTSFEDGELKGLYMGSDVYDDGGILGETIESFKNFSDAAIKTLMAAMVPEKPKTLSAEEQEEVDAFVEQFSMIQGQEVLVVQDNPELPPVTGIGVGLQYPNLLVQLLTGGAETPQRGLVAVPPERVALAKAVTDKLTEDDSEVETAEVVAKQ